MTRILTAVFLLVGFQLAIQAQEEKLQFKDIDPHISIFDPSELSLSLKQRLELTEALTAVARNVPKEGGSDPLLQAMALALANQLDQKNRSLLLTRHWLRHGLDPKPSESFTDAPSMAAVFDEVARQLAIAPTKTNDFGLLLSDIRRSLPSFRAPKALAGDWAPLLPRHAALARNPPLYYLKENHTLAQVELSGWIDPALPSSVYWNGIQLPPEALSWWQFLEAAYPIDAPHLQLYIQDTNPTAFLPEPRKLLFTQLSAQAFLRKTALAGDVVLALATDQEGRILPVDHPADRIFAFPIAEGPDSPIVCVQPGPPAPWLDYLLLDSIQPLMEVILFTPNHLNEIVEVMASDRPAPINDAFAALKAVQSEAALRPPEEWQSFLGSKEMQARLSALISREPRLLSAKLLRRYGVLSPTARASEAGSLNRLLSLVQPFVDRDALFGEPDFYETVTLPTKKRLRLIGHRIDLACIPHLTHLQSLVEMSTALKSSSAEVANQAVELASQLRLSASELLIQIQSRIQRISK